MINQKCVLSSIRYLSEYIYYVYVIPAVLVLLTLSGVMDILQEYDTSMIH